MDKREYFAIRSEQPGTDESEVRRLVNCAEELNIAAKHLVERGLKVEFTCHAIERPDYGNPLPIIRVSVERPIWPIRDVPPAASGPLNPEEHG
jgi:hypothetical protein